MSSPDLTVPRHIHSSQHSRATTPVETAEAQTLAAVNSTTPAMTAVDQHKDLMKVVSLVMLVVQGTTLPLLVRWSRIRPAKDMFISTVAVLMTEVVKFFICSAIVIIQDGSIARGVRNMYVTVVLHPKETMLVCIPSIIYCAQNNIYYVAISNLDAATFCVTYQLKLLTTALFFVWLLHRKLSQQQWFSLCLLSGGVALVQLQEAMTKGPSKSTGGHDQNWLLGFVCVVFLCFTSGFAGVYFEKVLKGSHVTVWLQNIRLAVLGIPLSIGVMLLNDWEKISEKGMFHGWDSLIWTIAILNGIGGLIIAVVIKYADNILKSYAQSVAIVLACVGSGLLFGFTPSGSFLFGAVLVCISVMIYAKFPYVAPATPSLQHVLLDSNGVTQHYQDHMKVEKQQSANSSLLDFNQNYRKEVND